MADDIGSIPRTTWDWVITIAIGSIAGWTGMAEGAWCGLSPACFSYIPYGAIGGVIFAPVAIIATGVVVFVAFSAFNVRSGFVTWLILAALMAGIGFAVGSLPGIHGQGP